MPKPRDSQLCSMPGKVPERSPRFALPFRHCSLPLPVASPYSKHSVELDFGLPLASAAVILNNSRLGEDNQFPDCD